MPKSSNAAGKVSPEELLPGIRKAIRTHHGARLSGDRWVCMCGADLGLKPEPSALAGATSLQITAAWAAHLSNRIILLVAKQK